MIEPYYQGDDITIYHADCLVNPDLWTGGDVLITDPPYGMSYVSNFAKFGSTKPIHGDEDTRLRDEALALWGDRPAISFGTWKMPRPEGVRQILVWDKDIGPGMGDLSFPWGPGHEEMYVFGDGWKGERRSNVIRHKGLGAQDWDRPKHPTPKPVGLMMHLIEYAPPGVIVDPFMGSGSTLRAARILGRRAIGVEKEEEYCEEAAKWLSQGLLF
jgi:DNA modification methylase